MPSPASPESPDPLSSQLREWRLQPRRAPEFRGAVRARLGAEAGAASRAGFWRSNGRLVAGAVLVAILGGALAGREQARVQVAAANRELARVYVQAHDARTMQMP